MACRSLEHGHTAHEDILSDRRNHGPVGDAGGRLMVMHLDYEDFGSIRQFADDFHKLGRPLHVLVNNGGIHLKPHKHVDCGFERTIAANYFGHFYLTQLLLDDLKAGAPSRVVNVASVADIIGGIRHMRSIPWDDLRGRSLTDSGERPYVLSKSYVLMANTRELARRCEGSGVDVIAVHPGITDSSWYLKADNDAYLFSWIISRVRSLLPWLGVGQTTGAGAISSIYASIAPELTGSSSSPQSYGIIYYISRALFGGGLIYHGPSYLANILGGPVNFFNTSRCWTLNPWTYNRAACKRLYEMSLDMIDQVESELGMSTSQAASTTAKASDSSTGTADGMNTNLGITQQTSDAGKPMQAAPPAAAAAAAAGGVQLGGAATGGLKQRQQQGAASAALMGVEEVDSTLSAAAQPLRGH